ncbi:MAG: zinc-dependent alcohol dehydrogenase family protein [Gemmatimonadetes bacterium]|nr:zinc-dependent alcohol dehydrogenase family protein [Gemmatimonadota bacterium]
MRAMRVERHGKIEAAPLAEVELPVPDAGPGEVLVRVNVCGVCHTDLHVAEGDLPGGKLPVTPGHQVAGLIAAVGPGVEGRRTGERVGVPWLYDTCGECRFCRSGRENLCDRALFTGHSVDGGYAEYLAVPEESAYRLPDGFDDAAVAPLLCGGVIGLRALRLSGAGKGDLLGLYGFGASAHIVIQIALYRGSRAFVFTRGAEHAALARRLGAEWVGRAGDGAPGELDAAIIFAPAGPLVPMALRALKKGGTLALAGIHMSNIPEMEYALLYGERVVRSVANSTRADVVELLDVAPRVPVQTDVEAFPLVEANDVLRRLKAGGIRGAAVLQVAGAP